MLRTRIAGREQAHHQPHGDSVGSVEIDVAVEMNQHRQRAIDRLQPGVRDRNCPAEAGAAERLAFAQRVQHHALVEPVGGCKSARELGKNGTLVAAMGAANRLGKQSERTRQGTVLS